MTGSTDSVKLLVSVSTPSLTLTSTTISPLKSNSGVIVNVEPVTSTLALPSTVALYDNSKSSTSVAVNVYVKTVSSSILWSGISVNTGASLISFTTITAWYISDKDTPS